LLLAIDGLTVAEAAVALGVPEGTVMSRVARARAALRIMTGRTPDETRKGFHR
jgi:RNA polymerase sigma-70 factor (ECF subfamily)